MRKKYTFRDILRPIGFLLKRMAQYPGLLLLVLLTLVVTMASSLMIPYFSKIIINDHILKGEIPGLLRVLALMAAVYLLSTLSTYGTSRILVRMSQKISRDLRAEVFHKMQNLPMQTFHTHTHGELMSTYTNDIDTINNFISSSLAGAVTGAVTFVGILVVLLTMNPVLTLVSGVFLLIQYLVMKKSGGISRKGFVRQQASLAELNGFIEEYTEGQKVVKLFHHEDAAISGFEARNQELQEASYRAQVYSGIINPALGGIAEINNAMTCSVGVAMTILGYFDLGSLVAFIQYVQQDGHQIGSLAMLVNVVLAAVAGTERVMAVLESSPEIDEGIVTLDGDHWSNGTPLAGHIDFSEMNFSYVPGHPVLKNITFTAEPGKKIALVGSTGAGKSTIVNLLNRFYEIDSGAITWAAENKIVEGYGDGTFGPEDNITREQMATILYRYAKYKGYDVTAKADITTFVDGSNTEEWAADAMAWAVAEKLINGIENNQLDPQGDATRAQMATILYRFCENVAK